ncbi:MAG: hypothetical protein LUH11_00050 [Candidatus Gastranaerophilales bacterium]|nr:hypothetical protein [Candidatus Gastranaerophilales bacterium]
MLKSLGFKKKIHVGISVSASGLTELICVDKNTKSVVKYSSSNIKYNNTVKEIMDFTEFGEVIENLFDEVGLNPADCAVTLSLPNVYFGITELEDKTDSSLIIDNLLAEIEDIYLFKKNEPVISYSVAEGANRQKNIIFSAIQAKVVSKIIEIFDNIEAEIVRIDVAFSSMLKALQYCDRFKTYKDKEEKTDILVITSGSVCSFCTKGAVLMDFKENAIAVKSFSTEELYSIIVKMAEENILNHESKSLIIISEIEEVNAELLSQNINFEGTVDYINKNTSADNQIIDIPADNSDIDMNMISYMTIEAVGAAVSDFDEYPLNINFLPVERINQNMVEVNGYEIDFYRFLIVIFAGAILIALIISFIVGGLLSVQTNSLNTKNNETTNDIQVFKKKISTKDQAIQQDMMPVLNKILETNKSVIDIYGALSTDIQDSIYIKKFVTNAQGGIGILGESKSSESVQEFVKGLREKNPDLMLAKLSINTKYDPVPAKIPNGFTFEIKTSHTDVELIDDALNTVQNELNKSGLKMPVYNNLSQIAPPPPSPVI